MSYYRVYDGKIYEMVSAVCTLGGKWTYSLNHYNGDTLTVNVHGILRTIPDCEYYVGDIVDIVEWKAYPHWSQMQRKLGIYPASETATKLGDKCKVIGLYPHPIHFNKYGYVLAVENIHTKEKFIISEKGVNMSKSKKVISPYDEVTITITYGELARAALLVGRANGSSFGRTLYNIGKEIFNVNDEDWYDVSHKLEYGNTGTILYLSLQNEFNKLLFGDYYSQKNKDEVNKLASEICELQQKLNEETQRLKDKYNNLIKDKQKQLEEVNANVNTK